MEKTQRETDAAGAAKDFGDDWQAFWKAYPRRAGPQAVRNAENAFRAEIERGTPAATLASAAAAYADECQRSGIDPKYIKQAAGWLSGGGWEDYANLTPPLPLAPPVDQREARYQNNAQRFRASKFAPLCSDWNRPEIVARAIREGLGTWDVFKLNGWDMPDAPE